jgi:hypothetical protein
VVPLVRLELRRTPDRAHRHLVTSSRGEAIPGCPDGGRPRPRGKTGP